MKTSRRIGLSVILLCSICHIAAAQKVAIVADKLYTMGNGPQGQPGVVLIENGKIKAVQNGTSAPAGYEALRAAYVTPGLIDSKPPPASPAPTTFPPIRTKTRKPIPTLPTSAPSTVSIHEKCSCNISTATE